MEDNKILENAIYRFFEDVSFEFDGLVSNYPPSLRTLVLASAQSYITVHVQALDKEDREIFDVAKNIVVTMTRPMDPDLLDPDPEE